MSNAIDTDANAIITKASKLGELAWRNGKMRFPGGHKPLMKLLEKAPSRVSIPAMTAWLRAWDTANLREV